MADPTDASVERVPVEDLPLEDLRFVVGRGLALGGHLLTAGERVVAGRLLGLEGPPGRLWARLSGRVPEIFALDALQVPGVPDVQVAVEALAALDLVDGLVPWSWRARASTRAELIAACRALGLPRTGRHGELVARLAPHRGWSDRRWVRLCHRGLLRRLERWALLALDPDRAVQVVARMGTVRWPDYPVTRGPSLHPHRRGLRAWEALLPVDALSCEQALEALGRGEGQAPGELDLRRRLRHRVLEVARAAEAQAPGEARARYEALVAVGACPPWAVAVRVARTLELEGRRDEALATLRGALPKASPTQRVAIERMGRRLGRAVGGFPIGAPLRRPPVRELGIAASEGGGRARWGAGSQAIEEAVAARLEAVGRRALRAEGRLWTTLYALLFAEAYFLPVPGALPAPFLDGPLDVGSPGFSVPRGEAVQAVLAAVEAGEAPARIRAADARWRGVRLAGARWEIGTGEELAAVATGLGPRALLGVLRRLLDEGWRAAAGLPDLVVLPGPPVVLADAFPARLGPDALLVEVKGPTDSLRDAQRVWLDRLIDLGAPVALWKVRALSASVGTVETGSTAPADGGAQQEGPTKA